MNPNKGSGHNATNSSNYVQHLGLEILIAKARESRQVAEALAELILLDRPIGIRDAMQFSDRDLVKLLRIIQLLPAVRSPQSERQWESVRSLLVAWLTCPMPGRKQVTKKGVQVARGLLLPLRAKGIGVPIEDLDRLERAIAQRQVVIGAVGYKRQRGRPMSDLWLRRIATIEFLKCVGYSECDGLQIVAEKLGDAGDQVKLDTLRKDLDRYLERRVQHSELFPPGPELANILLEQASIRHRKRCSDIASIKTRKQDRESG